MSVDKSIAPTRSTVSNLAKPETHSPLSAGAASQVDGSRQVITDASIKVADSKLSPVSLPESAKPKIQPPIRSFNMLELQAIASKIQISDNLNQMKAGNTTSTILFDAQKTSRETALKAMNEQATKQAEAAKKSSSVSFWGKLFSVVTAVVGVALMCTGVGFGLGLGMIMGAAIGMGLQSKAVVNLMTKACSALFGEKAGPIVAMAVLAVIQIAVVVAGGGVGVLAQRAVLAAGNVVGKLATMAKTAKAVLQTTANINQAASGITQGAMGIDLGITNLDLAEKKLKTKQSSAEMEFFTQTLTQAIEMTSRSTREAAQNLRSTLAGIQQSASSLRVNIS